MVPVSLARVDILGGFAFGDPTVNLYRRCPTYLVCDVGVDVQCGTAGYMADDG